VFLVKTFGLSWFLQDSDGAQIQANLVGANATPNLANGILLSLTPGSEALGR